MSNAYHLSEFVSCLKLGMWTGGEVEQLGYFAPLQLVGSGADSAGLWGIQVGFGVMLERSQTGSAGLTEMEFSVYDPYEGDYKLYSVATNLSIDQVVGGMLGTLSGESKKRGKWSYELYGRKSPFSFERKYIADYTSIRSGSIGTPGRRFS